MAFHKRKRVTRFRGSRNHGWGRMHRNSGQRGGAGNAGSGKKADAKKPSYSDRLFGKHGFKMKGVLVDQTAINVRDIEQRIDDWVVEKSAQNSQGVYSVDLGKLGYTKLLSTGKITKKIKITVPYASAGVIEKVKTAGGEVVLS